MKQIRDVQTIIGLLEDGKMVWFYQLYRPDLHITERVLADLLTVGKETNLPTYEGSPETQTL